MSPSDQDRQGFVELTTVAKALGLTPGQRIKLATLLTSDRELAGLRSDGTLPVGSAIKFCTAAKRR